MDMVAYNNSTERDPLNDSRTDQLNEPPSSLVPKFDLFDSGLGKGYALEHNLYSMNALEILRETIRILRSRCSIFTMITFVLVCPVSAVLLSDALVNQSLVKRLLIGLLNVARFGGLPLNRIMKHSCEKLSELIVSNIFCFPFFITFSLLSKAATIYSVACTYAGEPIVISKFFQIVAKIWKRAVATYIWACLLVVCCLSLFLILLFVVCNMFVLMGFPSEVIMYVALIVAVVFGVVFAHTIVICNMANVITVLEEMSGPPAVLRSLLLIWGQTHVGLLIFLGSTLGTTFVEGLFEHRVTTLSYGDGASRLWEGPLLVLMFSFVVMLDSMMTAVFYFSCRTSSRESLHEEIPHDAASAAKPAEPTSIL